ncbi:MAG TPA: flavodoxin family protein [Dehalococcoidia bacterium]|nr:flavodoxin family protein [Dehalococcoidia bacterium]
MSEVDINILGLSATPVKDGNCDTFVKESLKGARELEGEIGKVKTEFVTLAGKKIAMCQNCQWCIENKAPCKVKDDAQGIFDKIVAADGIIFGAPTWGLTLSPPLTVLWSRVRYYAIFTQLMNNKVTGYLTVGFFGLGFDACLDQMENLVKRMMIPVARGWGVTSTIFSGDRPRYLKNGVRDDRRGMLMAKQVGIRVVEVTRMIKYATQHGIVLPDEYKTTVFGGHWEKGKEKVYIDGVWRDKGSGG